MSSNSFYGIFLSSSSFADVQENSMISTGIIVTGEGKKSSIIGNTLNGKPILYFCNDSGLVFSAVPNIGQLLLYNCSNIEIEDMRLSTIFLIHSKNSTIKNNTSSGSNYGIAIHYSNNITLANNSMLNCGIDVSYDNYESEYKIKSNSIDTSNKVNGKPVFHFENKTNINLMGLDVGQIILRNCSQGILENLVLENTSIGILLEFCINFKLSTINSNFCSLYGLRIYRSNNNLISNSFFNGNQYGILVLGSDYNEFTGNIYSQNNNGLYLSDSEKNLIWNNSFFENVEYQAYEHNYDYSGNEWCSIHYRIGNYWSDYKERYPDAKRGRNSNFVFDLTETNFWGSHYQIPNPENDEWKADYFPLINSPHFDTESENIPPPIPPNLDVIIFIFFIGIVGIAIVLVNVIRIKKKKGSVKGPDINKNPSDL